MGSLRPPGRECRKEFASPTGSPPGARRPGADRRGSRCLDRMARWRSEGQHMRPVDLLLDRLEGVRQRGEGYQALCPAHEDREPSLSVGEGEDGRVLVKCFAGCETEDVI